MKERSKHIGEGTAQWQMRGESVGKICKRIEQGGENAVRGVKEKYMQKSENSDDSSH